MRVSILILTHKRPLLFERCLESVLKELPKDCEVIVNNDSRDIKEIKHPRVRFIYKEDENLSNIYNMLIDEAQGEYLYFLEDDDLVMDNFWEQLELTKTETNTLYFRYIPENNVKMYFELFNSKVFHDYDSKPALIQTPSEFFANYDDEHYQLGQVVFRKENISIRMSGNYLNNDLILFKGLTDNIQTIDSPLYIQTTDGNDNISFPEFCKDVRFYEQIE